MKVALDEPKNKLIWTTMRQFYCRSKNTGIMRKKITTVNNAAGTVNCPGFVNQSSVLSQ